MNTVSTPISTAIKIAGSQSKLAKIIGVHQTAISHFFLGRKRPSPEVAMKLQNAVNNQYKWYEFIGIDQGANLETPHGTEATAAGSGNTVEIAALEGGAAKESRTSEPAQY